MSTLVAEESLARLVAGADPGRLAVVPRGRGRRRGWRNLEADRVVDVLTASGTGALVLSRDVDADPGARVLSEIARLMGHETATLPGTPIEAAWAIGVAAHRDFQGDGLLRRVESLLGEMRDGRTLPRRVLGPGVRVPALRPAALARWAGCAWRACAVCAGGGPAGGRCARCGAPS